MNVLVSLHKGYGLGDAVQMSAVLRHVAAARPEWVIDYQAEEGKHQVGRGVAASTFAYGSKYPSEHYDAEVLICLYDTWANWGDRPNTRVSSCLREVFGLDWRAEYGRYQVLVRDESADAARTLLYGLKTTTGGVKPRYGKTSVNTPMRKKKCVAVHYQGDSSQERKNLGHHQASEICGAAERLGRVPLIMDWRKRSPLPFLKITTPSAWGADAEMVCAVISQCDAFVGIDSGPSKCAGATDTPALVVWTGHHPAPFHDPAPNTTHLVPAGYHGLYPVCDDPGVVRWFEEHYTVRYYEHDPVSEVKKWMEEVLT